MLVNTSLAHYQLPLFGLQGPSSIVDIGSDQRSVFLQPITTAGQLRPDSWPATVEIDKVELPPQEYRSWLSKLSAFQEAASRSSAAPDAAGSGGNAAATPPAEPHSPAAQPTGPDAGAPQPGSGTSEAVEAGAPLQTAGDDGATAAEGATTDAKPQDPAAAPADRGGSSRPRGGFLGGLLGSLFG